MDAVLHSLPYGKFYGSGEAHRQIPGFSLSALSPVLRAEDVPLHTHEEASFVLLLDGSYFSSAVGFSSECDVPTLIYNPPRTAHRDRFKSLGGRFLAISVSRDSFRSAADCSVLPCDAMCFRNKDIVSAAHSLVRESARWNKTSPLLAESICLELLASFAGRSSTPPKKPPVWLQRAKEMFYEECARPFRIAEAAKAIGVHPVHFARGFRRFFHCTPGEYLARCRMDRAVALLAESKLSLAEIALGAGFCDQSHFSNMFKRHFGLSPRAYRSQLLPMPSIASRLRRAMDGLPHRSPMSA